MTRCFVDGNLRADCANRWKTQSGGRVMQTLAQRCYFSAGAIIVAILTLWHLPVLAQTFNLQQRLEELDARIQQQIQQVERERKAGLTPLHDAAMKGDIAAIEAALKRGALINRPDAMGKTPLFLAAAHGHVAVIDVLLKAGARINPKMWEPLWGAAWEGHVSAIKALLSAGARITGEELNAAASNGHVAAIKTLLDFGADVRATSGFMERAPLHSAACEGQTAAIVALLNAGANIDAQDGVGETSLHCAASRGDVATTQVLLNAGANVNVTDEFGRTPLSAAQEGMSSTIGSIDPYRKVIEILQNSGGGYAGGDINSKDELGRTPLHKAARRGDATATEALLNSGANVNVVDEFGRTPLDDAWRGMNTTDGSLDSYMKVIEMLEKHNGKDRLYMK